MATGEVQVQNASRPSSSFEKAITGCFVLYLVSLLTTLAGCEGFGWILFTLTLVYAVLNKNQDSSGAKIFFSLGADKPFVALCTIVFIGYFFSAASDANFWKIVGGMRWGLFDVCNCGRFSHDASFREGIYPPHDRRDDRRSPRDPNVF